MSRSLLAGLISIICVLLFHSLVAQEWVEEAKKESSTRYDYEGMAGSSNVRALADYEKQYMEFTASGTVDMSEMVNDAQAELNAKSAAKTIAYAQAAEFISGTLVKAVYATEKSLFKDESVVRKVESTLIKFAKPVNEKVEWVRGVPVATATIGILFQNRNGLVDMVMPLVNEEVKGLGISGYSPEGVASQGGYTGVIFDARGLGVTPSIAPMVLTGKENYQVYGNLKISRDYAVQQGIAAYYKSVEDAHKDIERLGNNPLIIKAPKTAINNHHLWITEEDATRLYGADLKSGFLKECRVGIVVD